jgi:hypothetical protein
MADALATAIFVLGPEKGYALCQRLEGVDCLIVDKEGKVILSPGLKGRISSVPSQTRINLRRKLTKPAKGLKGKGLISIPYRTLLRGAWWQDIEPAGIGEHTIFDSVINKTGQTPPWQNT